MDPISLQKQLRDNSSDLQEYYKDIQTWGEEMKRKEAALKENPENCNVPLPRNKTPKRENKTSLPPSKSRPNAVIKDFSYWEKYDVEAECLKIDNTSNNTDDSDLTDEFDEDAVQMAQKEKKKGNTFVQSSCWHDAINCYTQAIALFSYDATFFANRALCHLKLEQYKNAEADCTIAIQLDNQYVKAIHRRAVARDALKQLKNAKEDLEMVLKLDPANKESQKLLDKIEKQLDPAKDGKDKLEEPNFQRPVSKFTATRRHQGQGAVASTSTAMGECVKEPAFNEVIVERKKPKVFKQAAIATPAFQWPAGEDVELVNPISKLPRDRSRLSLKHIQVTEATLHGKSK